MYQPRIYVHGLPNTRKTGAIVRTAKKPICFINLPGETGYASIPTGDPDIVCHPPFDPAAPSAQVVAEVKKVVLSAIAEGTYQTIAIEGLHNLMEYVMDAVSGGAYFAGELDSSGSKWSAYPMCYRWMDLFLYSVVANKAHQVILTGWSKEKEERKPRKIGTTDRGKPIMENDVPQTTLPHLIGEYSRMVAGRVPIIFHQTLRPTKDVDEEGKKLYSAAWQTRPHGLVKGCGIKTSSEAIIKGMPLYIPADYTWLENKWKELEG